MIISSFHLFFINHLLVIVFLSISKVGLYELISLLRGVLDDLISTCLILFIDHLLLPQSTLAKGLLQLAILVGRLFPLNVFDASLQVLELPEQLASLLGVGVANLSKLLLYSLFLQLLVFD